MRTTPFLLVAALAILVAGCTQPATPVTTPAPTVIETTAAATEAPTAVPTAPESITPGPTQTLPEIWSMEVQVSSNGEAINPQITATLRGGKGMNVIPAIIAGVKEIVMVTPPQKDGTANPDILAAAKIAGVDRVFLMGGAQAVAALAYGTQSVPKVDKIVGPGNIFVATAKKLLYGTVDIDMIAGPSEILIVADKSANPKFLAADLMSQAEHDKMASAILLTTSEETANETAKELSRQMQTLERRDIIEQSLNDFGAIIVCKDISEAVDFANELAPEHLELAVENPMEYIGRVDNAGSVFLGHYSPEPLGDYFAGPNHVLPTSGTARFFSPLSVDSFIKKSSFIYYTEPALSEAKDDIIKLAETEGLTAHANSIKVRF